MVVGLDDELLGEVARQLGNKFFRAGLLLGIQPHEMDSIQVCILLLKSWASPVHLATVKAEHL